ncbi:MAG TPA: HlyD family efflux transporter periplasmic adaptor subunit [Thermoanaerobaculia bacterium]|nr:HlyD family efflux transporter periplasmic adaptor subunit [Thermoanaerobaculia bacterium]
MKRIVVSAVLAAVAAAGCFSGHAESASSGELRVRRGTFTSEMVLSGELEAARGDFLNVPALPSWQTAIKWIAEEGAAVKAGEPVVELDNTALTSDLDSKRQTLMQNEQELRQREGEWAADLEQKVLDVEKKKAELDKAKLEAAVPKDLLSERSFEEKQGALRRTTVDHEKSLDLLRSRRTAVDAERRNLQLKIEKARREILIAEEAISALVLRAPRDGIVVVRDHPWEGRKLQTGDPVWVGFPIAMLPDLSSLRVKAVLADVDDGKIASGMPATITLDGFPGMPFTGRIAAISAVAQESRRASLRRQFDVLVALDKLDAERMRPGLSARIVVRRDARATTLLAPRAAIDFSGKAPRARMAGGELKEVKVGACNAQDCVVVSGLEEGARLEPVTTRNAGVSAADPALGGGADAGAPEMRHA